MGLLERLAKLSKGRERIKDSQMPIIAREILSVLKFLFFDIFLTYFIFLQCFLSYSIVISGSLTPTCHTNDIIIVSTIKYGIRSKATDWIKKLFSKSERNSFQQQKGDVFAPFIKSKDTDSVNKLSSKKSFFQPQRGDIVAFQSKEKSVIYQKRVVGIPGDFIQFKDGILYINEKVCPLKYLKQTQFVENDKEYSGYLYEEVMPNGCKYNVLYSSDLGEGSFDNTEVFQVPDKSYFMVGDNRQNSDDSRGLIGFVAEEDILGKAIFTLFSNSNLRTLNPISFIKGIKLDRWFIWIE